MKIDKITRLSNCRIEIIAKLMKNRMKEELATLVTNLKEQQTQMKQIELLIVRGQKYELAKEFKILKQKLSELIDDFENFG